MTLSTTIREALDDGMNLKLLLQATGLDVMTFGSRCDTESWSLKEASKIRQTIKQWKKVNI